MAEEKKENKIEFTGGDLIPKFRYIIDNLSDDQWKFFKNAWIMLSDNSLIPQILHTKEGVKEYLNSQITEDKIQKGIVKFMTEGKMASSSWSVSAAKLIIMRCINASAENMLKLGVKPLEGIGTSILGRRYVVPNKDQKFFLDYYDKDFATRIIDLVNNLDPDENDDAAELLTKVKINFFKLLQNCQSNDFKILKKYDDFKKKTRKDIANIIQEYNNEALRTMLVHLYRNPKKFKDRTIYFLTEIFKDVDKVYMEEKENKTQEAIEVQPKIFDTLDTFDIQVHSGDDEEDESDDEEIGDEIDGNLIISSFFIFFTFLDYIFAILSIINMTKLSEYLLISFYNLFISIAKIIILGLLLYFGEWGKTVTILLCLSMFNTILNSSLRLFVIIKQKQELSKEQKIIFNIPFVISIIISASFIIHCLT